MAVVIPFSSPADATIDRLTELVTPDMQRVNAQILSRTGWRGSSCAQCVLAVQNSTASSSACFIGEAGNSASASRAMAP